MQPTQRFPNSRKKPPKTVDPTPNKPLTSFNLDPIAPVKLINSKTDLIKVLNEADSRRNFGANSKKSKRPQQHLKPMPLFPPYFDLNSKPKLPSFNPLLKNNNLSIFDLEKLDDHILLDGKCYKFLNKVKKTIPLFHLDEVIDDFWSLLDDDLEEALNQRASTLSQNGNETLSEPQKREEKEQQLVMLHSYSNGEHTAAKKLDRIVILEDFEQFLAAQNDLSTSADLFLSSYIADKNERIKQEMIKLGQLKKDEAEDTRWTFPWLDYSSRGGTNTASKPGTGAVIKEEEKQLTAEPSNQRGQNSNSNPSFIDVSELQAPTQTQNFMDTLSDTFTDLPITASTNNRATLATRGTIAGAAPASANFSDLLEQSASEKVTKPEEEAINFSDEINQLIEKFKSQSKYLAEEDYEYISILLSAENSKELFTIIKSLNKIINQVEDLSEILISFEFKTPLIKRKLNRLLNNLEKILKNEIYTVYDVYLDEILMNLFKKLQQEIFNISAVEKDFINRVKESEHQNQHQQLQHQQLQHQQLQQHQLQQHQQQLTPNKKTTTIKTVSKISQHLSTKEQNTFQTMQDVPIKQLRLGNFLEEDYYSVYEKLTNFNVG